MPLSFEEKSVNKNRLRIRFFNIRGPVFAIIPQLKLNIYSLILIGSFLHLLHVHILALK